jgi:long-subunit acyl-CoA synthetase (AMP-forming)
MLGIISHNRKEVAIIELACISQSIAVVALAITSNDEMIYMA